MSEELYKRAMDEWGAHLQVDKATEECAELIQALARWQLGHDNFEDVAEELADVEIMCEQLRLEFGEDRIDGHKQRKLDRLEDRLDA